MATSSYLIFLSFLFIVLVPHSNSNKGNEAAKVSYHVVQISSILPKTKCVTSASTKGVNNKASLKLVHKHGPCSPSRLHANQAEKKTFEELYDQILAEDQIRVDSLHNKLSRNSRKAEIESRKIQVPASSGGGVYLAEIGFGTPAKSMSLLFDTGSDLTWIQCQPCLGQCFNQTDPIFDPSKSTSYFNVTCNTTDCSELTSGTSRPPLCSRSSNCIYGIQYGDRSISEGFYGREKLTLASSEMFENFKFGCGQNNQGLFGPEDAGILGLGRNKISFVSQTSSKYGGVFAYCLPSISSSSGYLSFGTEERVDASLKFTPMTLDSRDPSFYFLNLISIIVGNRTLPISATVFATSGTIIDSGTRITRLPPSAYSELKSAFQSSMSSYPKAMPRSIFDTCYNFTGYDVVRVPKITFVFQGDVVLNLNLLGILTGPRISQLCLAFAPNQNANALAILGNLQQLKQKVVYDVPNNRLGLGPGSCS